MVSGPSGSEEGKWGEVVRTQEMGKPRITRKGAKSRKCRIDEGSKRKAKQKVSKHTKQGKDHRRSEGMEKSEMHGEGCEEGEGSQGEGTRGRQSSVKNPSHLESEFLVPTIASQARCSVSASSSSSWVGRPQPAHSEQVRLLLQLTSLDHRGCPSSFLLNWWSGQSTRAEEHREHPLLRQDTGREQSFLSLTRSNPFTMKFIAGSRRKHMKSTTTNKGWLMLILVGAADDGDEEPVSIVLWAS